MTNMLDAPSFHRNKQPMLEVISDLMGEKSVQALEIASGSGQHGPFFTSHMQNLTWWPSDIDSDALNSINEWRAHLDAIKVMTPQIVDVTSSVWRGGENFNNWPETFDCILSMNMIHIAPYAALTGLIEGASKRIAKAGVLVFYGPFKRGGKHTAASNQAFDKSLKSRNPDWGIRDLEQVSLIAQKFSMMQMETIEMPANNLVVILRK